MESLEVWKYIDGYDGKYMVSNKGNIKSLYTNRSVHGKVMKINRERVLSKINHGNGYLYISLTNNSGERHNYYVHRLVADAFIENPNGYEVVNHKDFNKSNNCVENLEWCTQKQNVQHALERMRKPKRCIQSNTKHKYITRTVKKGIAYYEVTFNKKQKTFKTLDDALIYRRDILHGFCNSKRKNMLPMR